MQRDVVFHVHGLTKVYPMGEVEVQALRGVDLDLYAGELLVLLGPSGSGKSTLLNILGGLDTATGGEVYYRDRNLTHADENTLTDYRRHHVGFVFQFYNLIPSLTARENVAVVTEMARNPMTPEEALALVNLQEVDHFPAQLSGGQQQRVAIARAIAKSPAVLLAMNLPARSIPKPASSCSRRSNRPTANRHHHGPDHPQRRHRRHGRPGGTHHQRTHGSIQRNAQRKSAREFSW